MSQSKGGKGGPAKTAKTRKVTGSARQREQRVTRRGRAKAQPDAATSRANGQPKARLAPKDATSDEEVVIPDAEQTEPTEAAVEDAATEATASDVEHSEDSDEDVAEVEPEHGPDASSQRRQEPEPCAPREEADEAVVDRGAPPESELEPLSAGEPAPVGENTATPEDAEHAGTGPRMWPRAVGNGEGTAWTESAEPEGTDETDAEPEQDLDDTEAFLKGLVEAILFVSEHPLPLKELARACRVDQIRAKELVTQIAVERHGRGVRIHEVAGGYALRTSPVYGEYVRAFLAQRPVRLTRPQLETLSIVAYRQPITRPEIDDVRGVDCGPVLKGLLERDLIRILGKKDEPGRPMLYGTTPTFLEFFNLRSLQELPTLREFTELTEESRQEFSQRTGEEAPPDAWGTDRAATEGPGEPAAKDGSGAEPLESEPAGDSEPSAGQLLGREASLDAILEPGTGEGTERGQDEPRDDGSHGGDEENEDEEEAEGEDEEDDDEEEAEGEDEENEDGGDSNEDEDRQ